MPGGAASRPGEYTGPGPGTTGRSAFIDTQIGRLVNWLSRYQPDILKNTWFVFTADHGDMVGDHHLWRKTYAYEGSARIPLIVAPPTGNPGAGRQVAGEVVELRDIMPSILEAAGVAIPPTVDGRSLVPLLQQAPPEWRAFIHGEHCWCYSHEQEMQYVTDGHRKFVWLPRLDTRQFFDLDEDPGECRNLIGDPARQDEIEHWKGFLVAELEARDCGWVEDGDLCCPEGGAPLVSPYRDLRYQG